MKPLLVLVLVLYSAVVSAQCPDRQTLVNRYLHLRKIPDFQHRFDTLSRLRSDYIRCGYGTDSVYINLLNNLISSCFYRSNLERGDRYFILAGQFLNEALVLIRRHHQRIGSAATNTFYFQGLFLEAQERLPEAVLAFDEAINLGRTYANPGSWTSAFVTQAIDYYLLGDYEKSINKARIGSFYYAKNRQVRFQAQCLWVQAQALSAMNAYPEAEQLLEDAISRIRRLDKRDYDLADYYVQLGRIHQQLGLPRQALQNLTDALSIYTFYDDPQRIEVINQLGFLYLEGFKDPKNALSNFQKVWQEARSPYYRARACTGIGMIHRMNGEFEQALTWFQRGLNTLPIGFKAVNPAQNPSAVSIRIAAYKDFLLTLIQQKADTWLDYAQTSGHRKYLRYAVETYRLADQMVDFMRWEQAGNQTKLYWRQKTRGIYERAIETCNRLGDTEQAFRFFEKSRAVLLADKLNELGARSRLQPQQDARERQLVKAVGHLRSRLDELTPDSGAYLPLRTELLTAQDQLDEYVKQMERHNPAYYRYKYDSSLVSLGQFQQWLRQRKASLLTYFVGDSTLYLLIVTPTGAQLHRRPLSTYRTTVDGLLSLLAEPDALNRRFGQFLTWSHALYKELILPSGITDGRLIISPDGSFIPFETLSRSPTKPDYLIDRYAFSYAYSANLLMKERLTPPPSGNDFLGVAPVRFAPDLSQATLEGSAASLERIGRLFGSPTLLTGPAATRHAFQSLAPAYRVVQLFTHADADSTDREPQLYFADSTLRLSDFPPDIPFRTELLVLTACKTGIGANQKGEGIFSLARGFSILGIPSILTTLWNVESRSSYRLSQLFHEELKKGLSKDLALQQAKKTYLATADLADQLPNRWAGLILLGDTEPLRTGPSLAWKLFWITLLISTLALGLGQAFYRRKNKPVKADTFQH